MTRDKIYSLIGQERDRQDDLWGPIHKHITKPVFSEKEEGWMNILEEEVAEVWCAGSRQERIMELVQVAAVCVKWIEALTYEDK